LQDWQTATDIRIVFNRLLSIKIDEHSANADDLFNYRYVHVDIFRNVACDASA